MVTIALNIIMKDESKVLLRLLNSVYKILDYYVVVDTGSTDDSKKIVKDFFDEKGIPGEIHDYPFVNFQDARNFALTKVKGKSDYGFWIDCDEQLILPANFDIIDFKNRLSKHELHTSVVKSGSHTFARRNFFKIKNNFKWVGAVHEILLCEDNITIGNFTDITTFVNYDGNSWREGEQKKFLKHAQILEAEVYKTNEPRDVFYLAQSYKDAGESEKSIWWYRKRAEMKNGFFEEVYYSQFMVGVLYQRMKKPYQDTLVEYLKCSELDDLRAEHLLNAIIILQNAGLWQTAYVLSCNAIEKYHGKSPYPSRLLFIDESTYAAKIMHAHNLNKKALNKQDKINGYEINPYSNHIHFFIKLFELKKFHKIFEYGCGLGSTPFFLDHCERVVAIEMQSEDWYNKVKKRLSKYGDKLDLHCQIGLDGFDFIEKTDGDFDLVFVDGIARGECINKAFELGYSYVVTHDTEDFVYPYGWDKIKIPAGYLRYDFKEYNNWTTIFTTDTDLYKKLVEWKPFDNKLNNEINKTWKSK